MGTQYVFTHFGSLIDSTRVRVVPGGRLVVWSSDERAVRLVDVNGGNERLLVFNVSSDLGAFPRFDPSRHRVTLHAGTSSFGGPPNSIISLDTTGASRRDITPAVGFSVIMATREMADGTILVVAQRSGDTSHPGFSLWSVATDNTVTFVIALPQLEYGYGAADISHDGTRVAYIATNASTFTSALRVLNVSNGSTIPLEASAHSPRWSLLDDRIAYLIPQGFSGGIEGAAVVVNADGTGRRTLGTRTFSSGLSWSPDGAYIVGRSNEELGLRLIRVSDAVDVLLRFSFAGGCCHDYWQPDWR
jgi:Tol biopolymer transport system component